MAEVEDKAHRLLTPANGIHGVVAWHDVVSLDDVVVTGDDAGKVARRAGVDGDPPSFWLLVSAVYDGEQWDKTWVRIDNVEDDGPPPPSGGGALHTWEVSSLGEFLAPGGTTGTIEIGWEDVGRVAKVMGGESTDAHWFVLRRFLEGAWNPDYEDYAQEPVWAQLDNAEGGGGGGEWNGIVFSWETADLSSLSVTEADIGKVAKVDQDLYALVHISPPEDGSPPRWRLLTGGETLPTWFLSEPADLQALVTTPADESKVARLERNGAPEYHLLVRRYDEDDGEGGTIARSKWRRIDADGGWLVAFDEAFYENDALALADGPNTLDGLTVWTGLRLAVATSKAVVPGQGLVIEHGPTNTAWFHSSDTGPQLYARVSALAPDFIWGESQLRVSAEFEVAGSTSYDLGGIGIEKAFGAGQNASHKMMAGYAPAYQRYYQILMNSTEGGAQSAVARKANRLTMVSPTRVNYYSAFGSPDNVSNEDAFRPANWLLDGMYSPATETYVGTTPPNVGVMKPRILSAQDAYVVMGLQTGNTNGQAKLTVRRLRIEWKP